MQKTVSIAWIIPLIDLVYLTESAGDAFSTVHSTEHHMLSVVILVKDTQRMMTWICHR